MGEWRSAVFASYHPPREVCPSPTYSAMFSSVLPLSIILDIVIHRFTAAVSFVLACLGVSVPNNYALQLSSIQTAMVDTR